MSGMDDEATERLSIGTFARLAGLSPSALRFYDDCGVLPPAEVDPVTGYRRYAPGQRERAVLLRRLRAAGLPLVAAAAVLDGSPERARAVLREWQRRTEEEARLAGEALAEVLRELPGGAPARAVLGGAELAGAVRQVAPAADPGHPLLRCVLLEPADGELRLVATDRYRLSVRAVPARVTARPWPEPLLVEAAALREVAEWVRGAEEVALEAAGADAVWVRDGERERRLPLVAGEFPAYRLVLDALEPVRHRVIADRVALGAALSQARTPVVVRTGGPAGLLVGETAVPALVTGPGLRVAFDPVVLAGAVESAVGPDVLLELGGEGAGPVRVRSADQGGFTTLVMVVRDGS
ncbi:MULTISPECIES: DNA polymerase III subunit beta family protein [Streptomyces]|uniref:DNA polymerase III subunit beta family protein n=1 Tax=Streptomyces TaxID=1883 RepID=UPI0002E13FA5|nr:MULTISPECIES: MerR family transcriptional regulator [Streptomyces]